MANSRESAVVPTGKVIPYRVWVHKTSGRRVSIYGALPWTRPQDKDDWEMRTEGYTVSWPDGTTGTGRPPFKSRGETLKYVYANPRFRGMAQY